MPAASQTPRKVPSILLVEDDPKVAATVRLYLEAAGYRVTLRGDGLQALECVAADPPDLMILDLMLPGLDGRGVCRRIREGSNLPIILLTARTTEEDRLRGFDLGADDYVPKPFSPRELMARVRAVLRRGPGATPDATAPPRRFPGLEIEPGSRQVWVGGCEIRLTAVQFDLLWTLTGAPGRVYRREELVDRVLGPDFEGSERTIDAHIKNLRHRLGAEYIETVFGVGYRFPGVSPGVLPEVLPGESE